MVQTHCRGSHCDPHIGYTRCAGPILEVDQDLLLTIDNAKRLHRRLKCLDHFENCSHFCYQDRARNFTNQLVQNAGSRVGIIWSRYAWLMSFTSIMVAAEERVWHAPTFWRHAAASMSQAKSADGCRCTHNQWR
jgi:hypothetical protein